MAVMPPLALVPRPHNTCCPSSQTTLHCTLLCLRTGTTPSTAFSMTVFACTLGLITALCCAVRAAPEAFSRRQADSNIVIPPAILQELQDLGLTENALQVSDQNRCKQSKMSRIGGPPTPLCRFGDSSLPRRRLLSTFRKSILFLCSVSKFLRH